MDIVIVGIIVAGAVAYACSKARALFKPGRAPGCGCSSPKSGCSGCPLVKP